MFSVVQQCLPSVLVPLASSMDTQAQTRIKVSQSPASVGYPLNTMPSVIYRYTDIDASLNRTSVGRWLQTSRPPLPEILQQFLLRTRVPPIQPQSIIRPIALFCSLRNRSHFSSSVHFKIIFLVFCCCCCQLICFSIQNPVFLFLHSRIISHILNLFFLFFPSSGRWYPGMPQNMIAPVSSWKFPLQPSLQCCATYPFWM